jgi:predicted nicotinamide N-methyase
MRGKTLLEIGCGPALVAMIAARLVGTSGYVCATDGDDTTVKLAAQNLALIPENNTAAARFWWGTSPEEIPEMRGRCWDYIVASDVAYEPAVFSPLCEALVAASSSNRWKFSKVCFLT